jgi:hypothetical protein
MPKDPDDEDWQEEMRHLRYEDRLEREEARAPRPRPETCRCGARDSWMQTGPPLTYGEDADGNRGRPLFVFECKACQNEVEVLA